MQTLTVLFDWFLQSSVTLFKMLANWSWVGASIVGLVLLRKIINLIRKVY